MIVPSEYGESNPQSAIAREVAGFSSICTSSVRCVRETFAAVVRRSLVDWRRLPPPLAPETGAPPTLNPVPRPYWTWTFGGLTVMASADLMVDVQESTGNGSYRRLLFGYAVQEEQGVEPEGAADWVRLTAAIACEAGDEIDAAFLVCLPPPFPYGDNPVPSFDRVRRTPLRPMRLERTRHLVNVYADGLRGRKRPIRDAKKLQFPESRASFPSEQDWTRS